MILKALYDYYNRCDNLPAKGMEEKEIGFLIVLSPKGEFLRFEDCRTGKDHARLYLVKKHVGRSSAAVANYLYDNSAYVLGYSDKSNGKEQLYFDTFKTQIEDIAEVFPDSNEILAVKAFYDNSREEIIQTVSQDPLWENIKKNLSKKYSTFSFRIEGDLRIVAEKKEILQLEEKDSSDATFCLVSGEYGVPVDTTTATMIPGSQATAKLVAFQVNSGYDSYGKSKCGNAPISEEAEFAYTTALNSMLQKGSRNKFMLGTRTFVFWASNNNEASIETEESLFELFGFSEEANDDPNAKIMKVRKVFESIYSGIMKTELDDKFYILGLAPNSARIAVVYWSETTLKDFAEKILRHFSDMEIHDTRKDRKPYMGIREIISSVTLGGKMSDATPNLPEAVVKSIFQGLPYPQTLYSACIRRIRAEQKLTITRAAIIKAYLNRQSNNNKKIDIMLDKDNNNQGYLCGRLFAVLENLQFAANGQDSIRSSYMNAASTTPSTVFSTILKLSNNHYGKLAKDKKGLANFFDNQKKEIMAMLQEFPDTLELNDQGRFFLGYYHQKNYKENNNSEE
ncbi:MAG: type I-C CRISPR-associated protein Cas8c/Csd1 [Prevotella sp.]|nr:type I-C CRISPR-associated protein Cas8c/Csd1 [Prevotella sp.]